MTNERVPQPTHPDIRQVFSLNDAEHLDRRVNHERFLAILTHDQTTVHAAEESCNNYGEFLFVTASREALQQRVCLTFFGLGFHEYRERWFTDEWFWYSTPALPAIVGRTVPKEEALAIVQRRLESVVSCAQPGSRSEQSRLFELLADLTDEDGAWAELDDLEDLMGWLRGESWQQDSNL